jgi:AcrR family transcriptional regulator
MVSPHVVSVNMRMTPRNVDNVNMASQHIDSDEAVDATDRRYHHGNLRAALIEAGLAALSSGESTDLSLRAIARAVGVSANAAYRHFADKEALLSALAAEGFRRFAAAQRQAVQGLSDPIEARTAAGLAYIAFARQHPALFRLMFGHFTPGRGDEDLQQAAITAFDALVASSARESGSQPGDERAFLTAIARWSLVHGLSHLLLDGQLDSMGPHVEQVILGVLTLAPPAQNPPQAAPNPAPSPEPKAAAKTPAKAPAKPRQKS